MLRKAVEVELAPAVASGSPQGPPASGKQIEGRMDAMAGSPGKARNILEAPRLAKSFLEDA